ncbi:MULTISPECIES: bifunctional type I 3-dehydroquinate dehydratase/shikimate dehydrogenase [unclassified Lentimicrobium]|uniref:bifunctional type I 3-dehydroquinate dehydratase/shikimate dehydrogenase n=1 Tax=unclassified Lentimicrobium TaxID=2677434 RepID=UPI001556CBD6|nr:MULTISPECIES: bifunctional type I 3-dehydroquinate dehydratase/shikimate dehydrogenase [unclassified Lentimicrobium]NPD44715.1 type I 3-dehydroquinate dehydratase [Lentimicrobium sp. S6]NPD83429.1 type I 3-dehydroquinate dehydratase [Lentimicrobium sp. L6]
MRNRSLDGRVCESFFTDDLSAAIDVVEKIKSLGELRFDLSQLRIDDIEPIKSSTDNALIFTCRGGNFSDDIQLEAYLKAIESNYSYIDIDLEHDGTLLPSLYAPLSQSSCQLILSYHNYNETPSPKILDERISKMASSKADLIKIATLLHSPDDIDTLIKTQNSHQNIICLGMGELATESRIKSILNGGAFTFTAYDLSKSTAKGQLDYDGFQKAYMNYRGGKSIKLAVLGNPIAHSKSPVLFKEFFEENGINGVYEKIELEQIEELKELQHLYDGFNVTAPFKLNIIPFLNELSDSAKSIGAVNTVFKKEMQWYGDNTDYLGILNSIKEVIAVSEIQNCLIIGAGGAARAAAFAMNSIDVNTTILNRTYSKAKSLAEDFSMNSKENINIEEFHLIINTVPSPFSLIQTSHLQNHHIILDAIYPNSQFIPFQKEKEFTLISGEKWLFHQAKAAYDIFIS